RVRRAGVSSFSISGTNAHVILEEAPQPASLAAGIAIPGSTGLPDAVPLLLSGRDETALAAQASRWAAWLATADPERRWADVVYTAALGRTHFDARASVLVKDEREAREALEALAQGQHHPAVTRGNGKRGATLAMLFSGQGSQRLGMGRGL